LCGIFGAIGTNWNLGNVKALAWANRERGTDSIGFFDSTGKMVKCAADPSEALRKENITNWLNASKVGNEKRERAWFIAGHTRYATRGKVNRQNSHPFRYGNIIGSHNGMVDAPNGYVVDSQMLFDLLDKANGDYQTAWGDITGYWGVSWFDGESFYLQVHNGDLSIACDDEGTYYYSSAWSHLESVVGHTANFVTLKEGETMKFTLVLNEAGEPEVAMEMVKEFASSTPDYWTRKYGCSNTNNWKRKGYYQGEYDACEYTGTTSYYGKSDKADYADYADKTEKSEPRDYDEDWRDAWESYATESEHSKAE
jgi:hypothetical protein